MKSGDPILVIAALAALAGCSKSDDTVKASDPVPTVTESTVDETATIVEDETQLPPADAGGPAMDSIQEEMPPANGTTLKK